MRFYVLTLVVLFAACASGGGDPHRTVPPSVPFVKMSPIWSDAKRCDELVSAGRVDRRAEGSFRVAVWNVRWFPDGWIDGLSFSGGTDLDWLACGFAWLNADVISVQEFKMHQRARDSLVRVTERLQALTGDPWAYVFDECPDENKQHLGYFYRTDRVELSRVETEPYLDPTADDRGDDRCGRKRPGFLAYVTSKRGGLDFTLGTVHLDSGREPSDFENRREAWRRFEPVSRQRISAASDRDVVFVGDFNTMGCPACSVEDSPSEIAMFSRTLGAQTPAFRVLPASVPCTEYYKNHGSVLDHVIVSKDMRELRSDTTRVCGVCGDLACKEVNSKALPVFLKLSDHCPLIVEFDDVDLDEDATALDTSPGQR